MTPYGRQRWIASTLATALAVGVVVALAAPSSAATTTVNQSQDLAIGDRDVRPNNDVGFTVPATSTSGPAAPYPSTLNVPASVGAPIVDIDVDIDSVTHEDPTNLDIMLVGPGGQQVILMSDAGNSTDASNAFLFFDDDADDGVPSSALVSGDYQPTNSGVGTDPFDAPAPASTDNTLLSVFNGTSAAGVWSLYVMDDESSGSGSIGNWQLHIETETQPYPSTLAVSGLPPISDLNVRLNGISSTYLDDIDLLLVGPAGQQATLMSDTGGGNDISNVDLVLDDEATGPLPDESTLTSGTFTPTNYDTLDLWPPPAPASDGGSALSVFDGLSPNGEWSLYAVDAVSEDATLISGWALELTWADTASPSGTISVNGGAASTSSSAVTLNVSATDPAPASGVKEMRFSNNGVVFSAYQPYAATAPWTLTTGEGAKAVYAQFRDADGNESVVVSDVIELALADTVGPKSTKTLPTKRATGVTVTAKVRVKASEALKGSTVNKRTVVLRAKVSSKRVTAQVSYHAGRKVIVLTPDRPLKKGTKYLVTVKSAVTDAAGNAWDERPVKPGAQALKFSFITA